MKIINKIKLFIMTLVFAMVICFVSFGRGWVNDGEDWQYIEADGIAASDCIKMSGEDKYYLKTDTYMARDYLLEDYNSDVYYFDDNGKMVKNTWVAVDPIQVQNQMDNSPTIYLYYFGASGKAFRSSGGVKRKVIDGKKYLFNEYGQMLSGWIDESGNRYDENDTDIDPFVGFCYYAGDETDGVLREGWTEYIEGSVDDNYYMKESLWFYFKPSDCKKFYSEIRGDLVKKKINGYTYAFDENGVMIQGWDSDMTNIATTSNYFSEVTTEGRGRMHKKEWVFAVPSKLQDYEDHDAEVESWFYSLGSGNIVKNEMKRINTDWYVFDEDGIMKKGLCIVDPSTRKYVDCIDCEKTDGRDFIISRHYISVDKYSAAVEYQCFDDTKYKIYYFELDESADDFGKRKIGKLSVPFGDDDYQFESNTVGEYEGLKKKKYYQSGILLRADKAHGVGLVFLGYASSSNAVVPDFKPEYYNSSHIFAKEDRNHKNISGAYVKSDYIVISTLKECYQKGAFPIYALIDDKGTKTTKSMSVKKDSSGFYWMIGENQCVINAFQVPIRYKKTDNVWQFRSETIIDGKSKTDWLDFGTIDIYGKTCYTYRTDSSLKGEGAGKEPGGYELYITEPLCVNFRFSDD